MPRCFNPGARYHDKLAALPPEEAAKMEANRRAKMSAGIKKTLAIKRIVNAILKSEVVPNSYEVDILNTFGYEINECGLPTAAVMILLSMAARALKGDVKAAEFLFSYGGIPNMDQMIKLDELKINRDRCDMEKSAHKIDVVLAMDNMQTNELKRKKLEQECQSQSNSNGPVKIVGFGELSQLSDADIQALPHRKTTAEALAEKYGVSVDDIYAGNYGNEKQEEEIVE